MKLQLLLSPDWSDELSGISTFYKVIIHAKKGKWVCFTLNRCGSMEVFESSLAYAITVPDNWQNRKKVICEGTSRSRIQRVRKQQNNNIYVVFLCSAFVLAPVKQETLENTISLKEKQQCVKIQIEKKNYNQEDLQPEREHTAQRIKYSLGHHIIRFYMLINLVFEHPIC